MAEEEAVVQEVDESLEISRGSEPEHQIKLSAADDLYLTDEDGNKYKFGDLYKDFKTVFVFIRHFLCFMSKEYVDDLALVPNSFLQDARVRLVVVGCGPHKFIKSFRYATGYKYILLTDPDREVYKALGLYETAQTEDLHIGASKHVKSNYFMGVLKSTWRGMVFREMQGDYNQQGGALIVGPGPVLHHAHKDRCPTDHAPVNDLLALAGINQVNYKLDRRVLEL